MKLKRYVQTAVLMASLLIGGVDAPNPYGPCAPKQDNRPSKQYNKDFSGAYKPGGCIPEPFGPTRPDRPAFPEELRNRIVLEDIEGKEINKPEVRGDYSCVPAWVHPLMPHVIPEEAFPDHRTEKFSAYTTGGQKQIELAFGDNIDPTPEIHQILGGGGSSTPKMMRRQSNSVPTRYVESKSKGWGVLVDIDIFKPLEG